MLTSINIIIIICLLIVIISFYVFAFRLKWREIMSTLLTPLVHKIPSSVTPNHLTILNLLFTLSAGLFIYLAKYNFYLILGAAIFIFLFGANDSLDGILARARRQVTKSGTFLDYTLDKVNYLLLLYALMLGQHISSELVIITMLCSLFYSFINIESQVLTGSTFPLAERPRWLTLAIILCLVAFLLKLLSAEVLTLWNITFRSLDALFSILPIYLFIMILYKLGSLWRKLIRIDQEEMMAH